MKAVLENFKTKFLGKSDTSSTDEFSDDYVEITPGAKDRAGKAKIVVRPFIVEDFADIKPALDALREGYTIALINIRPLKDKDIVELKRAVNKLKKTCDAIEGDIAGFGDDWVVVCPSFAGIYRSTDTGDIQPRSDNQQQ